ncbi:hypothetical protein DL95DRAFT_474858 [Leptodontidium sp. 2 PMI_412]|nr:hypothetical protein DL95DRAFT_474858 [Leptodontidium sp. 2 PMI_412]
MNRTNYFVSHPPLPIPNTDLLSWMFDDEAKKYDRDKPVYIDINDATRTISYNGAKSTIRKLVKGFQDAGLQKGDCVIVHSFNDIYYSMLVLGIIAAGGIFTGTNPSYTANELTHHIKTSKARFIISEPQLLPTLLEVATSVGIPESNMWVFDVQGNLPPGQRSWQELLRKGESDWARFNDQEAAENTTACRLFSSGTTGLPKAVSISHRNLVAQHMVVHGCNPLDYEPKYCMALPIFHAAAVPLTHTSILREGWKLWMMRRFDLELYVKTIQDNAITTMGIVPPIAIALIKSPTTKKYSLKSVRNATVGAAPLTLGTQQRLRELLGPGCRVVQGWGMTETCCVGSMFYHPEDDNTASVGRLVPNLQAKLVDDDGNEINSYDVRGELCVRGPTVAKGYFENPEANARDYDKDGFFHTGDIAFCDSKTHKWYIVDRKKELIKVRSFQVAPAELEAVLLSHPSIIQCAVIGVTDEDHDELPRAYVVLRPGTDRAEVTEESVKAYAADRLAVYKRLEGGVRFVNAIPMNASGKILKTKLRECAKRQVRRKGAKM